MQWCPLLTGVGTTLWQVYHHTKQVIISPLYPLNKNYVFLGLIVLTISLQYLFLERK